MIRLLFLSRGLSVALLLFLCLPSLFSCDKDREPLRVFAGQSLVDALREVEAAYEEAHPGSVVEVHYAGTGTLRQQVEAGAPADVFAAPSCHHVTIMLGDGAFVEDYLSHFASNRLVLVVPADSTITAASPEDLASAPYGRIALGDPERMAAGDHAQQALDHYGLGGLPAERGIECETVRQVLMYAARGEVDAAFVFQTDAAVEPNRVRVVWTAPAEVVEPVELLAGVLTGSEQTEEARRFVEFLSGAEAREIWVGHGFLVPR